MEYYVDLDSMQPCSAQFLTRNKRPGLIVKNLSAYTLTNEDLQRLKASLLDESATGDVATGYAVRIGEVYKREYRSFTPEEITAKNEAQALKGLQATDADAPHILEMLIILLIQKGVVLGSDFPQDVRDKLADRKAKREAL